ncbi:MULTISPECIES: putative electron transfer flavoprotein FixA [unclassified Luteococcus]|uniref:putative electron transfer flavoprotein FixA n=1 Tax=unclassified Luteococcus TaxID=2639923 RepID=UPI00313A7B09
MRIIACFKATPDDADISIGRDGSLDLSRASWKIGSYDLNAIEAARQLADQLGGEVIGLTVGGAQLDNTKLRKDALSRGLDQLTIVTGDTEGDSFQTASLLAAAIRELGAVDLVLLGAGSSDRYAQQVGNILGGLLGLPTLNAVDHVEPAEGGLRVERALESQTQILAVDLPAVLSVTSGINTPRIPGMRDILAAGKKPVTMTSAEPPAASTRLVSVTAPQQQARQQKVIEGEPAEVAAQLAAFITSL